MSCKSSY